MGFFFKPTLRDHKGSHITLDPQIIPAEDILTVWVTAPQCYTVPKLWSLLRRDCFTC